MGKDCEAILKRITSKYDDIIRIDVNAYKRQWHEIQRKNFLLRYFAQKKFLKTLRQYGDITEGDVSSLLASIENYQKKNNQFKTSSDLAQYFGRLAQKGQEQWEQMETLLNIRYGTAG